MTAAEGGRESQLSLRIQPKRLLVFWETALYQAHTGSSTWSQWILKRKKEHRKLGGKVVEDKGKIRGGSD